VKDSPLAEVSRVDEVIEAVKQLGDVLAEYASVRPSDKENRSRYDRILACILTHSPVRDRFFRGLLKEDQKRVNLTPADELQKILENVTPAYYTPEFCESLNKAIIKVCQYTLPEIKANPQLVLMYADDFAIALMDTAVWERDRINAMSGGEIKRMLASLRSSGIEPDFSDWRLWKERHARRAGELASKAGAHVGENTVDNARRLIKKLVKSPAEEQAAAKKKADELRVVADAFRAVVDSAKRPRQLALPARSTVEDVNTRMAELDRILRKEAEAHERVISEGKEKLAETPVAAGKPETEMIYQARVLREAKERATQLQAADAAAKAAQEKRVKEAAQPLSGILVAATVDCRNPYELLSKAHKDAGLTTIRIATTARSLLGLKTISEDVYNQGLDILRTVIAIRINPSILPQVKTKLEDELLRWFDTPPRQEELPQLAFVKAIADIGKREDLPDLSNLAKDAEAVAVGLPPALNTEYEKIEKAYLEFVKSIYEQPPQPIKR